LANFLGHLCALSMLAGLTKCLVRDRGQSYGRRRRRLRKSLNLLLTFTN